MVKSNYLNLLRRDKCNDGSGMQASAIFLPYCVKTYGTYIFGQEINLVFFCCCFFGCCCFLAFRVCCNMRSSGDCEQSDKHELDRKDPIILNLAAD